MAASIVTLRRHALGALILLTAGCAQFQWTEQGPGAPGMRTADAPPDAPVTGQPLPHFDDEAEPEPFPAPDRDRIVQMQPWVEQNAARLDLDPDLINGVIWVESRFQPRAKSPAGARGLMQLMPATANALARQMGRSTARVYDPEFNIQAGSLYLLQMLDRFDGDETLALAAYNAGAGNVSKWMREDGQLPPRSLEYVEHVQRARLRFVAMREASTIPEDQRTMIASAPPEPAEEPAREDRPRRAEVPPPPPRKAEPRSADNPLAPDPDVYRPEPTPEPPLADTPYPPLRERPEPIEPEDPSEPVEVSTPESLPSVLD